MYRLIKKPYEISVWEDRLVTENEISYYKEIMLAVIGASDMISPNRSFDNHLRKNVNGEIELEFSMIHRYYSEEQNGYIINPYIKYLVNERKIKLKYNGEWYDFIIKSINENSKENVFTYTAQNLYVNELAKEGYNVELSTELSNNQGTIFELAETIIEDAADWEIDRENSDIIRQYVQEPLYIGEANQNIECIDVLNPNGDPIIIPQGEEIYFFYSTIVNNLGTNVHILRGKDKSEDKWELNDNNVFKAPNYRLKNDITFVENCPSIVDSSTFKNILNFQGYRLAYDQLSKYDPVVEKYVDLYKVYYDAGAQGSATQDIYHYIDYEYLTSDVLVNYVTDGSNFNQLSDGSMQGWSNTTKITGEAGENTIELATYPEVSLQNLKTLKDVNELRNFLRIHFNGTYSAGANTFFNSGIQDSNGIVGTFSKGEEYALRIRYGISPKEFKGAPTPDPNHALRVKVAEYKIEDNRYVIDESKVYFDFDSSEAIIKNNIESGGTFDIDDENKKVAYIKQMPWGTDVVPPSKDYYYKDGDTDNYYKWDVKTGQYLPKTTDDLDSYFYVAECLNSLSNIDLSEKDIGIFLYTKDVITEGNYYYWIEYIELFKYRVDKNNEVMLLGMAPESTVHPTDYFYLPNETIKDGEKVETFSSIKALADYLGVEQSNIQKVYNIECEKIGSIEVSQSNYYNNIQSLCEAFECWARFNIEHEDNGEVKLDEEFNPIKTITFHNYVGKDNFSGFKYGINLEGIERSVDSDEIVSKLIVAQNENEYVDGGLLSIRNAKTNPSGESYILNFSYYIEQGLINGENFYEDLAKVQFDLKDKNNQLNAKNEEYNLLKTKITKVGHLKNVYVEELKQAQLDLTETTETLEKIVGTSYDDFMNSNGELVITIRITGQLNTPMVIDMGGKNLTGLKISVVRASDGQYIEAYPTQSASVLANTPIVVNSIPSGYDYPIVKDKDTGEDRRAHDEYQITLATTAANGGMFKKINDTTYTLTLPIADSENEAVVSYVGKIIVDNSVISSHTGITNQLVEEYESLVLKADGPPEYTVTISNTNNRTRAVISDFKDGFTFTLKHESDTLICKSSTIDKIFEWGEVASSFTIDAVPSGYELLNSERNKISGEVILPENSSKIFYLSPLEQFKEEHKGIQEEIKQLQEDKKEIEKEFNKKYSRFIQEGTWTSDDHVDNELYYLDALQVSNTSAKPKVSYTIDVLEISQVEGFEGYDFDVGDKTYMQDTEFFGWVIQDSVNTPVSEEVIVSEVTWNLDDPSENQITVQNYKTQFEDLFQRISATVQSVEYKEASYSRAASILDTSGLINSDLLGSSLTNLGGGFGLSSNGAVRVDSDGIVAVNITNNAYRMKLASDGLKVSTDGGVTWTPIVAPDGVNTRLLTADTIDTSTITILNGDQTSFRWDSNGLTAFSFDNEKYNFSKFVRMDEFGLYGINGIDGINGFEPQSTQEIKDNAFFGITWDGFFIKNSYTDGYVSISSDNDFQVIQKINDNEVEKIKIGALEFDNTGAPTKYGINIKNNNGDVVFTTGDNGDITITGTINAAAGNIGGMTVNSDKLSMDTIVLEPGVGIYSTVKTGNEKLFEISDIDGSAKFRNIQALGGSLGQLNVIDTLTVGQGNNTGTIKSINYDEGSGSGWLIDSTGDAYFNNITARGAIKTAVFEYAEIQAVGGVFLFRPSSTIRSAAVSGENLVLKVEKPQLFKVGQWCKVSNYISNGEADNPDTSDILLTNGLTHIYQITDVTNDEITLVGAKALLTAINKDASALVGGALIDMGNKAGTSNYGIGVNSSDNTVNLPARAISLFETTIDETKEPKVTYNYRGILGTLPQMNTGVDTSIYQNMQGTQGIYTDNMYIGDEGQFIAFYEDDQGHKQLRIKANQVVYEVTDEHGQGTGVYHDVNQIEAEGVPGADGKDAIQVIIDSSAGNMFFNKDINATLTCTVLKGGTEDITNQVTKFTWKKKDKDGNIDSSWSRLAAGRTITIGPADIASKAIFICEVEF